MELDAYVETIRHELAVAAEAGGPEAVALAERLVAPLESAVRLMLLEALSDAAAEITRDLAPGSVDLRLRGREPSFVVTAPPHDEAAEQPAVSPQFTAAAQDEDAGAMARINVRLTDDLKGRVEDAARQVGLSVNAWLVRAAAAALQSGDFPRHPESRAARGGERFNGWVL